MEECVESMTDLFAQEIFEYGFNCLVPGLSSGQPDILLCFLCYQPGKPGFKYVKIVDDTLDITGIEGERFFEIVEDPDNIEHEPCGFPVSVFIFIGPVNPGNCLEEDMIPHGFVEIHAVEDGGIKSG